LIGTEVFSISQLGTATDATVLAVTVLCAGRIECAVSGGNVIRIIEIDRWVGGRSDMYETRGQHERRSGARLQQIHCENSPQNSRQKRAVAGERSHRVDSS
jgi:hypothetical protein